MSLYWNCPHCGCHQIAVGTKLCSNFVPFKITDAAEGEIGIEISTLGCSAPACKKLTVDVKLGSIVFLEFDDGVDTRHLLFSERIYPRGAARVLPHYIPNSIQSDYFEACLIRDLSPKAAATLIRRCLQGVIRDFTGIKKGRLVDEIQELRSCVEAGTAPQGVSMDSVEAIDAVRHIGNVGAHMEKDVNLIIDVERDEAQALIELTEMLFDEWYVARYQRAERLWKIKASAEIISQKKNGSKQIDADQSL